MKTKSDELWYYYATEDILYIFETKKLQKYLKQDHLYRYMKDGGDNALGLCIPCRYVERNLDHKKMKVLG